MTTPEEMDDQYAVADLCDLDDADIERLWDAHIAEQERLVNESLDYNEMMRPVREYPHEYPDGLVPESELPPSNFWQVYAIYGDEEQETKIFHRFAKSEEDAIKIGQEMAIARQGVYQFLTFECVPPLHVVSRRRADGLAMLNNLHKMAQTPHGIGEIQGFDPREHTYEVRIGEDSYFGIPDCDVEIL
jgi:hypothetical protein